MTLIRIQVSVVFACMLAFAGVAQAYDLYVRDMKINKLLFLGSNTTVYGPSEVWWGNNWGMAASAASKDYVHVLLSDIAVLAGDTPEVMIKSITSFETDTDKLPITSERDTTDYNVDTQLAEELAFNADVVVVAIGENAGPDCDARKDYWRERFTNLLTAFKNTSSKPTIFVCSRFRSKPGDKVVDDIMQEVTAKVGGVFLNISSLDEDPLNLGRTELGPDYQIGGKYEAVGKHPGDAGMAAIAKAIRDAMWANTTSPEPGALTLLIVVGAIGLLACAWRKRKKDLSFPYFPNDESMAAR